MIPLELYIIPKYNLIPEYRYKTRMDFMDWVYNSGGIIGMWFGWSALSIANLFLLCKIYLTKYCSKYYSKYKYILVTLFQSTKNDQGIKKVLFCYDR